MHDIKWIRENPGAFDAGLKRRGLEAESAKLLALDEKRRSTIHEGRSSAGAPQRGLEGDRRGEKEQGRGGGAKADGRGRGS